jgi:hypothetical protein
LEWRGGAIAALSIVLLEALIREGTNDFIRESSIPCCAKPLGGSMDRQGE